MTKRKKPDGSDGGDDQSVPIPIQIFLWRQTSPFIRPKLGKLCEASCVSFERVIVQNILHGLSPSLCEAIESISRWRVVRAAFPHILHCCAAMISARDRGAKEAAAMQDHNRTVDHHYRRESNATTPVQRPKFTSNEVKLLYALHWLVLDSASECEDADNEANQRNGCLPSTRSYLLSLDDIHLFVFLLAPLVDTVSESDFQTLKLENGLRLWEPLWSYTQPDVPCFTTPVRMHRVMLKAQRPVQTRVNFNMANIYVGHGCSTDGIYCGDEPSPPAEAEEKKDEEDRETAVTDEDDKSNSKETTTSDSESIRAPLARMSDICALSTTETAISVEQSVAVCDSCQRKTAGGGEGCDCHCKPALRRASSVSSDGRSLGLPSVDAGRLESAISAFSRAYPNLDVISASCFDVAVMRCLFCSQWPEPGVYWGLRYIHRRLLDVVSEKQNNSSRQLRERSQSLPVPKFQMFISPPGLSESPPSERDSSLELDTVHQPAFKRSRALETGQASETEMSRPDSALSRLTENEEDSPADDDEVDIEDSSSDATKRSSQFGIDASVAINQSKCRPKLDTDDDSVGSVGKTVGPTDSLPKPIITITTDSQGPSPVSRSPLSWSERFRRDSQISTGSRQFVSQFPEKEVAEASATAFKRSHTDTKINYTTDGCAGEDVVNELPGSVFYVGPDGQLDYRVVLMAMHVVAGRSCTTRICGVLLNVINCLVDLGIITGNVNGSAGSPSGKLAGDTDNGKPSHLSANIDSRAAKVDSSFEKSSVSDFHGDSTFCLAVESVFRVFKSLGCPHGCRDGIRGCQADDLRSQAMSCLQRLMTIDSLQFRFYLHRKLLGHQLQSVLDQIHALVGFCADPTSSSHQGGMHGQRRSVHEHSGSSWSGYAQNFGELPDGGPGVQDQIVVQILKPLLNKCVRNRKELFAHENIGLYCDVRQFLTYVKETHGSTFRRVALGALLDALKYPSFAQSESVSIPQPKPMRRTQSVTSDSGDERDIIRAGLLNGASTKARKSIFRRKLKKTLRHSHGHGHSGASDPDICDDNLSFHGRLSPRVSVSIPLDDEALTPTMKQKPSKFSLGWRRGTAVAKLDYDDDSASESPANLLSRGGSGGSQDHLSRLQHGSSGGYGPASTLVQRQKNITFKSAGQATLSILKAGKGRTRMDDSLRMFSKRPRGSICGDLEALYRTAHELGCASGGGGSSNGKETNLVREKKLVSAYVVKSGMLRFNFMLDCCNPGTLPDAHLMAALLDLEAPVVARAAMFLECAHLVSRCNHGDWPHWMKLNLPGFCPSGLPQPLLLHSRGQPSGYRRNLMLQRATGRLFHQWAEAIGNHLSDIMAEEMTDMFSIVEPVKDEVKKKELKVNDEEEDFLNEATVNSSGSSCPYALKMIACHLLLEITSFLRETYQHLPRNKVGSTRRSGCGIEPSSWSDRQAASSRRWSSVLGSPGNSECSNSRSSQGECHVQGSAGVVDRKISFAVLGTSAERSDSLHSSTTSLSQPEALNEPKGRNSICNQKLLKARRGSGGAHNMSFKQNRSFRMRRQEEGGSMKRMGSAKTRKVSTQSLQSTASTEDTSSYAIFEEAASVDVGGSTSVMTGGNVMTDDYTDYPSDNVGDGSDETDYSRHMPWVKVVVQLANSSNFICDHVTHCHPNCYERQRRSCNRLVAALHQVYGAEEPETPIVYDPPMSRSDSGKDLMKDKLKRRESMFQSSPTNRRDSVPLVDKVKADPSLAAKAKLAIAAEKEVDKKKKSKKNATEELPVVKYLNMQILTMGHTLLALVTKAAAILSDDLFVDMMPVAWELLIENDQELAAAAAAFFSLASVRVPESVKELMTHQLNHSDVAHRTSALLRFSVLWRFRFQVWPRMEDGAHMYFKVPPPSIDFVLPSPTIGLPLLPIVDPPWMPHYKAKVEEMTINQTESKSFVTATTTRRKQQQQMVHRALLAEEDRRRAAREHFRMLTVPVCQQASCEPALLHSAGDDHDEAVIPDEVVLSVASRRMSVAPVNRAASNIRNMSGRHGSMFFGRSAFVEGDDDKMDHFHPHHVQNAQQFFPSCLCNAVIHIIQLLEDLEVNADGVAVCAVAKKVVWDCLVEDPTLFLRVFLEKLTLRNRQEELIFLLRKLLYNVPALPAQTAHSLFNYVMLYLYSKGNVFPLDLEHNGAIARWEIGFIMFYVRSPAEGGQEAVAKALSILWLIVPSVSGIYFKDLKQTLRKEQCDPTLMVTANVPSAKKLIVHGPDLSCIPSQFPIQEDTQFLHILHESLDFFNIPAEEQNLYFLVDTKTNQMHNINSYVRDFYFFRRNFYPQLSLVRMNPEEATATLRYQALLQKFGEMGKALFSLSVVESSVGQQVQSHVSFLHEELLKLPSFPRKALESELGLYHDDMGEEISGMDLMHKYVWTKLIARMFHGMSSTITHAGDLPLFLNVVNGTLLLHADDTAMLRLCMATFINACRHFKQVFSTTGFTFIMPTILKVYSNNQSNPVVCDVIQFTCKQFFLLHRNPFVLQMFGSVSTVLNISDDNVKRDPDFTKVCPDALFRLLVSLGTNSSDQLNILELVDGEKPLQPLDFCYKDDSDVFSMIDAINLCVTVVAYACDSARAVQMLAVLHAILPPFLRFLKDETSKQYSLPQARDEMSVISSLSVSIRALITSCEMMARNFSGPQRQLESMNAVGGRMQQQNHANHTQSKSGKIYADEQSDIRFINMEEGLGDWRRGSMEDEAETALNNFRRPRNLLLCIVSNFFSHCTARWRELRRVVADPSTRMPDLLDHKSHINLADIVHTLLKLAPYDPATMKSPGLLQVRFVLANWYLEFIPGLLAAAFPVLSAFLLQSRLYMLDILPITDWTQTAVRPALILILRRLERMFSKIYKKYILRNQLEWCAATQLVTAVHRTLANCAYVAHLPYLKALITTCLNIVVSDDASMNIDSGSDHSLLYKADGTSSLKLQVPAKFCSATIKLTALQMHALGDLYSLEQICGGLSIYTTSEKTVSVLLNLVLPLCIRMGSSTCNRKENPCMRTADINFALTVVLHALLPPVKQAGGGGSTKQHHLSVSDTSMGRTASVVSRHGHNKISAPQETLQNVAFLGLRLLMLCFEKQLSTQWHRISKSIVELGTKLQGGAALWKFLDFVVTTRMPLFILLKPFIQFKMMKVTCDTEQEYYFQQTVYQKLQGCNMPSQKCKGSLLVDLAAELRQMKDEIAFADVRAGAMSSPAYSNVSQRSGTGSTGGIPRTSSIHDLLEHHVAVRMQSVPTVNTSNKTAHSAGTSLQTTTTRPETPSADQRTDGSALLYSSSKRICAKDGSQILARYMRKAGSQDEDVNVPISTACRKLQRQLQFVQSGTSDADTDIDDEQVGHVGLNAFYKMDDERLCRRSPVIVRGVLRKQKTLVSSLVGKFVDSNSATDGSGQELVSAASSTLHRTRLSSGGAGQEYDAEDDGHMHRLQRQDAKSRKTFKIKRNYSTIKGSNVSRSATLKGGTYGTRHHAALRTTKEGGADGAGGQLSTVSTECDDDPFDAPSETGDESSPVKTAFVSKRMPAAGGTSAAELTDSTPHGSLSSEGLSDSPRKTAEDGQSAVRLKTRSESQSKPHARFMQKSKSHDSDSLTGVDVVHVASGTARARIARHGAARNIHSHSSPSGSPTKTSASGSSRNDRSHGFAELETFLGVTDSQSDDDGDVEETDIVGNDENDERPVTSGSASSSAAAAAGIMLCFDDTDLKDTRV